MAGGGTAGARRAVGVGPTAVAAAWVVLLLGLVLSATAGVLWARNVQQRNDESFESLTTNVRSAVSTAVQRQDDLLATVQGMVDTDPQLTNREFREWYDAAGIAGRYPSGFGVGYIERVPATELDAFAAELAADPPFVSPAPAPFELYPDTGADVVCLQRLTVWRGGEVRGLLVAGGFDLCAAEIPGAGPSVVPSVLDEATTTGEPALVPPDQFLDDVIVLFAPVYDDTFPATTAERESSLLGWVGATFSPDLFLAGTPVDGTTAVEVERLSPGGWTPVASGGSVGDGGVDTAVVPASDDGVWRVEIQSTLATSTVPARVQGLLVLLAGSVISLLGFVIVRLLLGSRQRALEVARTSTHELHHLALHDGLTGLANRTLLLQHAQLLSRRSQASSSEVAVLFLDLDDFKAINDSFGHTAGDAFLRAVAERLRDTLRATDIVGRIGGDEFVVIVEAPADVGGVDVVADRVLRALSHPIEVQGVIMPVSCSIGIATGSQVMAADLLRQADLAMYRAKSDGKARVVHFEPVMLRHLQDRIQMEWDLRSALEQDQLRLRFQPVVDLTTGEVTEVEALARWLHPTRGMVPPDQFIPAAERTGLIVPIGRWVLETACREAATWRRLGTPVPVAVNISARQLEDDSLVRHIETVLADTGLDPSDLVLEVTETSLMRDVEATERRLRVLDHLGVRIAIDDFGTGYSSMAYLQRFPVHQLKIDRQFVADLPGSEQADALVRTLIQLGQTLGLETLAEGVEEVAQHHRLLELGCDSAQGYLYSRPMDPSTVPSLLAARGVAARHGSAPPSMTAPGSLSD